MNMTTDSIRTFRYKFALVLEVSDFLHTDFTVTYGRIMQFDKNKSAFIHQWYPFVEGYSKDFINSILKELDYEPKLALDPFAGSGTTPVEMQDIGLECYSFEVSPFMHLLATVKLERNYTDEEFQDSLIIVGKILNGPKLPIRSLMPLPLAKTFQPKENLKKWVFDREVMNGILDIKYAIQQLTDIKYQKLFKICLAAILLDISNTYRDGKSLKYKKNWQEKKTKRKEVHAKFLSRLTEIIRPDIIKLEKLNFDVENKAKCIYGDVRQNLALVPDQSIDLVVTSPPYLNSRDYTDIYIAELWMLDLVNNYDELRALRKRTLRSHVQVKHGEIETVNSIELKAVLMKFEENDSSHWNNELIPMIKGYFHDMNTLFTLLKKKMIPGKKIFFNVANSAYHGIEIQVDEIVAQIAVNNGFVVNEIRKARNLKPSSQQKELIGSLRETVIVLTS